MQDNLIVFPEPPPRDNVQLVAPILPVPLTQLVGREHEVKVIQLLLSRPDVRLLTLTGTAGVGKTRLAFEVARELVHEFADGVHVVSLAPISDPDLVITTIAHRLGLMESGSQPILELLKIAQRDKQRLLVLDNFEHVIGAAPLLAELLEACPDLKLLVTSREVLRLRGEHQFVVPPLALPAPSHLPDAASLPHVPSVKLFLQRAQAIQSDFDLTTENAAAIAAICIRLDGLPLAIELAAAHIKLLAPQALLARLDRRLHILTGGARDLPERQRTLRNTLAWSYELLTQEEQQLFRRLSVFVGGCTLEAIEAVCVALDDEADHVLEAVASLIDKSLLQQTEQEGAEPRLIMLETIREYGLECLAVNGEMEITRRAHADYYLVLAEEAEPKLDGPDQVAWLERLEREHDNLRAAMQWSLEPGKEGHRREMALRLGGALRRLWIVHGHWSEGRNFLERALAESKGVPAAVQVKALITAANLANMQTDSDRAEVLAEKSRELCQELGDTRGLALSLRLLAVVATKRGDLAAARSLSEEALMLFREVGDQEGAGLSLSGLGWLAMIQGEYAKGRALFEESLALHRQVGNKEGMARSLIGLAVALINTEGDPATIRALLEESLARSQEVGNREGIETSFFLSGQLALSQGDIATARELVEKSLVINREIGNREDIAYSLFLLARVEARQGHYAAACALYEQCLAMAIEGNSKWNIDLFMQGLAGAVAAQGEPAWAARLYGADEAFRDANSRAIIPVYRAEYEHSVAATRAQLGEQAFAATWAEGRTMTFEQVLAEEGKATVSTSIAIGSSLSPPAQGPKYPAGLTAREMEVLRLLAQGLTSAQIAERLVIGLVTVNSHVRSIYSKLGVTSRAAATRYALEHHLL